MDAARFDALLVCLARTGTRRAAVGRLGSAALGLGGLALLDGPTAARRKKRRKRRGGSGGSGGGGATGGGGSTGGGGGSGGGPSVVTPSLEQCRGTCGDACACNFSPAGEINCGRAETRGVCTRCQSGSDCPFGTCFAGFFAPGQAAPSRFGCDYPAGVCADLLDCPA